MRTLVVATLLVVLMAIKCVGAPSPRTLAASRDLQRVDFRTLPGGTLHERTIHLEGLGRPENVEVWSSCACLEVRVRSGQNTKRSTDVTLALYVPRTPGVHSYDFSLRRKDGTRLFGEVVVTSFLPPFLDPPRFEDMAVSDRGEWSAEFLWNVPSIFDIETIRCIPLDAKVGVSLGVPENDGVWTRIPVSVWGALGSEWLHRQGFSFSRYSFAIDFFASHRELGPMQTRGLIDVAHPGVLDISPKKLLLDRGGVGTISVQCGVGQTIDAFARPSLAAEIQVAGGAIVVTPHAGFSTFDVELSVGEHSVRVPVVVFDL